MSDKPDDDAPEDDAEEQLGLECPKCGCCDFRAYYTRRQAKGIRRVKICRHCGRRITTTERIVG